MEDDVIILSHSDDDDCCVLGEIINVEPIVVDLTEESDSFTDQSAHKKSRSSKHRRKQHEQPQQQQQSQTQSQNQQQQDNSHQQPDSQQNQKSPQQEQYQTNNHKPSSPPTKSQDQTRTTRLDDQPSQPFFSFQSSPSGPSYKRFNFQDSPRPPPPTTIFNTFSRQSHSFFQQPFGQHQQPKPQQSFHQSRPQQSFHQHQPRPQQQFQQKQQQQQQQPRPQHTFQQHQPRPQHQFHQQQPEPEQHFKQQQTPQPQPPKPQGQPPQQHHQPTVPLHQTTDKQPVQQPQPQQQQHQSTVPLQQTNNKQPEQPRQIQPEVPQKPLSDHELLIAKKNLGNENYKNNLLNEAVRTYREANELAKKLGDKEMSATIHFNLAMTYDRLGSCIQAADECAEAVKLKDNYMKPHLKRAEIYERLHKFEEAVICWEHICDLDPSNRDYAIRLARVREAAKRLRKKDPHELLGLHPINFSREELKKAYKRKALTHHPDRHPDADIVTRRIQEKLFKDASEAHSYIQVRFGYSR